MLIHGRDPAVFVGVAVARVLGELHLFLQLFARVEPIRFREPLLGRVRLYAYLLAKGSRHGGIGRSNCSKQSSKRYQLWTR